jgi:RNA polymerase sigma factor (sigma-70 family)
MWPQSRQTATTEAVSEKFVHDGDSDSAGLSAKEQAVGASGSNERVGADADDAMLARAALTGQVWAQREIWFRFAPMVYGLLRRALGRRHDHDDLTQEVFLRVFRKLHTLEKVSAIRSFVYSVAVRVVSEEVRRFAWRRRIIEQRPELSTSSVSSPPDFEARETMLCVQRSLDGMYDRYRAVFILRYVDGMESKEVAAGLGISQATVKRYLAKALASICESVAKEEDQARTRFGTATPTRLFGGGQ